MVQKVFHHSWLVDASKERDTAKVNIYRASPTLRGVGLAWCG